MPRILSLLTRPFRTEALSRTGLKSRPRLESLEERVVLSQFGFPKPLDDRIPNVPAKKQVLLTKAETPFQTGQQGQPAKYTSELSYSVFDPDTYHFRLSTATTPDYFKGQFKDLDTKTTATDALYNYVKADGHPSLRNEYWVDFSNAHLGGGVFGNGFAQEEVMFLQTPELANAAAYGLKPRVANGSVSESDVGKPFQGSPQPYIFFDVRKTMTIDILNPKLTKKSPGDNYANATVDDLKQLSSLDNPTLKYHVIAMAAPDLRNSSYAKTDPSVLADAFNTYVAGFTLARDNAAAAHVTGPIVINTGKIGAGAFGNSIVAAYVLQVLAARQVGNVDLKFWYFDKSKPTENINTLDTQYVQPILSAYRNQPDKTVARLLSIAEASLKNAPAVTGASAATVPILQGRKGGAMLGFTLNFDQPMDAASLANLANYQVSSISQRRVRGAVLTRSLPIRVLSVTVNPGETSVVLNTRSLPRTYLQGGRINVGGLLSSSGLGLEDTTFVIGRGARTVSVS
ncbi:MAG: hypothetical protein U0790_04610 [Isosphaeraceae bacterium]